MLTRRDFFTVFLGLFTLKTASFFRERDPGGTQNSPQYPSLRIIVKVDIPEISDHEILNDTPFFFVHGISFDPLEAAEVRKVTLVFTPRSKTGLSALQNSFTPGSLWICTGACTVSNWGFTLYNPAYDLPDTQVLERYNRYAHAAPDRDAALSDEIEKLFSEMSL